MEHLSFANQKYGSCSPWNERRPKSNSRMYPCHGCRIRRLFHVEQNVAEDALRITLCSRCLVFHVEQCGARSLQNLYKNFFVPRETACTSIGTLLNFRHTESWGRFDKNHRGGKSKRRGWENNYRCKSCGLPRYRRTTDTAGRL